MSPWDIFKTIRNISRDIDFTQMIGVQQFSSSLSLGCLGTVATYIGTPIPQINRTNLYSLPNSVPSRLRYTGNKETDHNNKKQLPCIYPYYGTKGTFAPSNVCFIDIDTIVGVDDIITNYLRLLSAVTECCQIIAIQKSYSGKLHIIVQIPLCETEEQWSIEAEWANNYVLQEIQRLFGYDYKELPATEADGTPVPQVDKNGKPKPHKAWDTNNLRFSQAISISHYEIYAPKFIDEDVYFIPYKKRKNQFTIEAKPKTTTEKVAKGLGFLFHEVGYTGDKILVDSNFCACGFWGDELRYRLPTAAYSIFGDDFEIFIKNYFSNAKEILSNRHDYSLNRKVAKWLVDFFKITRRVPILQQGEYLTKYGTAIRQYIEETPRAGLIAPTGSGKTTLIKEIAKEKNTVILCPYVTVVKQYANKSDGITLLKTLPNGSKLEQRPYVATFDKALKYDLRDRLLIIDESHILYVDTTYRKRLAHLLHDLKQRKEQRILLVTATPCGEFNELGVRNPMVLGRERNTLPVYYETVSGSPLERQQQIIADFRAGRTEWGVYDKLVIFDDRTAKGLYARYPDDSALLASETKYTEKFGIVMEKKQLPDDKMIFSTKICYNGVDFKDDGNILVVVRFTPGETLPQHVVQCAGRFRNPSANLTLVILETKPHTGASVAEKVALAKMVADSTAEYEKLGKEYGELAQLIQKGIADNNFNDEVVAKTRADVERYTKRNATREALLKLLKDCGYFDLRSIVGHQVGRQKADQVRPKISNDIRKQLADGIAPKDLKIDSRLKYAVDVKNKLVKLTELQPDGKVLYTYRQLAAYVEQQPKQKLIHTIADELKRIAFMSSWEAKDVHIFIEMQAVLCARYKDNKRALAIVMNNARKYLEARAKTRDGIQMEIDWSAIPWQDLEQDLNKPAKTFAKVLEDSRREKEREQRKRRERMKKRVQLTDKRNNTRRIYDSLTSLEKELKNSGYTEKAIRFLLKQRKDGNYNIKMLGI